MKRLKYFSKPSIAAIAAVGLMASLFACSGINDSWEAKGGGYIKYSVGNESSHTIELARKDVEIPFIKNSHRYLLIKTRAEESSIGDQFSIMVNRPVLGENQPVQGQYSWFVHKKSSPGRILAEKSIVKIDQKDDSTWTADLDLYAKDCHIDSCPDSLPPIHINGRFRYWISPEDR